MSIQHDNTAIRTLLIFGDARYGGSTYLAIEWIRTLLRHGIRVDVQCSDPTSLTALRAIDGLRVIDSIWIPREPALGADLRALAALTALIRRERYQIVQTSMTTASFVGRLAARLAGAPVIIQDAQGWPVTSHSSRAARLVYTPLSFLAGLLSTQVVCAGEATMAAGIALHTCPRDRMLVIPNGIDPQPFLLAATNETRARMRAELGIAPDCLAIGNANRLAPQKDNATLIRAMPELCRRLAGRECLLLLSGDGPERASLEALARQLGLCTRVRFLGFRQDIPQFLAAIDLFANTSLWEGLSISLLEAMAAGKPIVTTDIAPNAELIEHQRTGLLVTPGDSYSLADALADLAHHCELAQGYAEAARRRVLERYTIERRNDAWWSLYTQLLRLNARMPACQTAQDGRK